MLGHGFPRVERLFDICWGFARMVNSCMSPLRPTQRMWSLLVHASVFLNWIFHLFPDLPADKYLSGDSFSLTLKRWSLSSPLVGS